MSNTKDWDKLDQVGNNAALTENTPPKKGPRAKNLKAVPEAYFTAHNKLKAKGGTSLDFSAYIIEAAREKLERDNAL